MKQNTKEELQYWREQKNKNKFEEVKKIANYPKFDSIIYPDVNKYLHEIKLPDYDEITGRVNKQTHLKRFVNWVKTTDFPPVKICRQVIGFISGLGGRGDSYRYYFRRICGAVFEIKNHCFSFRGAGY